MTAQDQAKGLLPKLTEFSGQATGTVIAIVQGGDGHRLRAASRTATASRSLAPAEQAVGRMRGGQQAPTQVKRGSRRARPATESMCSRRRAGRIPRHGDTTSPSPTRPRRTRGARVNMIVALLALAGRRNRRGGPSPRPSSSSARWNASGRRGGDGESRLPLDSGEQRGDRGASGGQCGRRPQHRHRQAGRGDEPAARTRGRRAGRRRSAADRRMRQFVTDASHELRTPLAVIQGYAELTRQESDVLPETTEYALARIESEAKRMSSRASSCCCSPASTRGTTWGARGDRSRRAGRHGRRWTRGRSNPEHDWRKRGTRRARRGARRPGERLHQLVRQPALERRAAHAAGHDGIGPDQHGDGARGNSVTRGDVSDTGPGIDDAPGARAVRALRARRHGQEP